MRLLCDGMLGRLTRWLRMLGYDTKYLKVLDDELIEVAEREHRILLTRDLMLYKRARAHGVRAFLVKGENEAEKLADLAKNLNIKLDMDPSRSRCPKCNSEIKSVRKEDIINKIPEMTARFHEEFWICKGCGQIYWRGSHWKRIMKTLIEAKRLAKE